MTRSPRAQHQRRRALLAATCSTAILLAACGGGAGEAADTDVEAEQTITVWGWSGAPGAATMQAIIEAYEEQNENITVEFNEIANTDYANQATLALSSEQPIDVIGVFPNEWATESQQFLLPVEEWPESEGLLEEFQAPSVEQVEVLYTDGVARSVPMYSNGSLMGFYNVELLEEAGFSEAPSTWDEMEEFAQALEESAPDVLPAIIPNDSWLQGDVVLTLAGAENPDFWNSVRYEEGAWDTPELVEALETYRSLFERGILDTSTLDVPYSDAMSVFHRGDAAVIFTGAWEAPLLRDEYRAENGIDIDAVGAMPMPADEAEARGMRAFIDTTFGIPLNSEHKSAAADFIRFMTAGDGVDVWGESLVGAPAVQGWDVPQNVLDTEVAAQGYQVIQDLIANPHSDRNVMSNFENQQGTYALEVAAGSLSPEDAARRGQEDLDSGRYN